MVGALHVVYGDQRIGPFETQDVTHRLAVIGGTIGPLGDVLLQAGEVTDGDYLTRVDHRFVPGTLPLRLRPGLFGRMPARQRIIGRHVPRNLRGNHQTDISLPQLGQRDGRFRPVGFIGHTGFAGAEVADRLPQIAVPLQCVHTQVQVRVDDEHGRYSL